MRRREGEGEGGKEEGEGEGGKGRERGRKGGRGRERRGREDMPKLRMIWNDYNVCTQVSHIKISGKLMRPLRACGHAYSPKLKFHGCLQPQNYFNNQSG